MDIVTITVRTYPNSRTRSYFISAGRLCDQDGFIFTPKKKRGESYGIIAFRDVLRKRSGFKKLGPQGDALLQRIAMDPLSAKLVQGRLTSSRQLDVEFTDTKAVDIDMLIGTAIGRTLRMHPRVIVEK